MNDRGIFSHYIVPLLVILVYLFLYIPIVTLIVFSFNRDELSFHWVGFTTQWYSMLFTTPEVWDALKNSLIIAGCSVALSITMGSFFVFFIARTYFRNLIMLFYANLAIPEIVLAVGLLSFFYFMAIPLGMTTLITCHTLIGLGYVVPIIYSRFIEIDKRIVEASLDLGATQIQTFFFVVLPLLFPALFASALLVFIISFDDFILSFFCAGASTQTLPLYIFAMIRAGASPIVSALSTILLVVSSILVLLFSSLHIKKTDLFP
jgi:spermidine/putrescine transport system permease protein